MAVWEKPGLTTWPRLLPFQGPRAPISDNDLFSTMSVPFFDKLTGTTEPGHGHSHTHDGSHSHDHGGEHGHTHEHYEHAGPYVHSGILSNPMSISQESTLKETCLTIPDVTLKNADLQSESEGKSHSFVIGGAQPKLSQSRWLRENSIDTCTVPKTPKGI